MESICLKFYKTKINAKELERDHPEKTLQYQKKIKNFPGKIPNICWKL